MSERDVFRSRTSTVAELIQKFSQQAEEAKSMKNSSMRVSVLLDFPDPKTTMTNDKFSVKDKIAAIDSRTQTIAKRSNSRKPKHLTLITNNDESVPNRANTTKFESRKVKSMDYHYNENNSGEINIIEENETFNSQKERGSKNLSQLQKSKSRDQDNPKAEMTNETIKNLRARASITQTLNAEVTKNYIEPPARENSGIIPKTRFELESQKSTFQNNSQVETKQESSCLSCCLIY